MKIKVNDCNGVSVLTFDGEFSVFFIDDIETTIFTEIDRSKGKIILDLSDVNYLDSSGISLIVTSAQKLKKRIPISGCQPNVKYVLELAEIDNIVDFYDTVDDAVKSFK